MNFIEKELRLAFANRIDARLSMLTDVRYFTEIIKTIAEREDPDAIAVALQSMLAIVINPDLRSKKFCGDLVVYSMVPYNDDKLDDINRFRLMLTRNEIIGIVQWLKFSLTCDFGAICNDDIIVGINYWSAVLDRN